jgi:2-oxoglutarate dehydrogenase E2 component (dihydrolipoamide succinyltransferase)
MIIDVVIPSVGESISEVEIGEWQKAEGSPVQRDDTLVIIETDKASVEIPAPESGTLAQILKHSGDTAAVGEAIARIEQGKAETPAAKSAATRGAPPVASAAVETAQQVHNQKEARKEAEQINGGLSAQQSGVEEEGQQTAASGNGAQPGPGPEASASAESADRKFEAPSKEPAEPTWEPPPVETSEPEGQASSRRPEPPLTDGRREETVPMTALRRRIAQRLVQAQQTAALLTTFNEIDMSRIAALRKQYRDRFEEKYQVKLGLMSFFVKAAVAALKASPEINAEIRGDTIVYRRFYDIGIAVGSGKGLVVPVLRDAERKSFAEIEVAVADFARRAREARLNPEDLAGGTFTISNGGIYGSLLSTPIVNPPQSAILGMHAIQERPVARDGAVVIRPMMYVALTYDHRLVDGREAVSFLRHIKELVEEPTRLLFEI